MRKPKILSTLAHEMHRLYQEEFLSLGAIGKRFGFCGQGVRKAFHRNGLPTRTPAEAGPIQGPKRSGDNHYLKKRGPLPIKNGTYRSQRIVDADGRSHKRRTHVIMMESVIGRRILPHECVHHINGNRHDNRLENLQLMTRHDHAVMEMKAARRKYPDKFIRQIGPDGRFLKQEASR